MPAASRLASRPWRPDLRRSIHLFREFGYEQPDPARFYTALANDSVAQLSQYANLEGADLLDVGGGPGYFRDAFRAAGARYWALDADVGELAGAGEIGAGTVIGSGMELPFADNCLDVCYSSNVLEHVSDPWRMADEMVRVTKPGGLVFLSYTLWYGPWGGHETSPWHFTGGLRARRRYSRKHGHEPKNKFGESLFKVTARAGTRWARRREGVEILALIPRYHPKWAWWMMRTPGIREVATWNLAIVLRKR